MARNSVEPTLTRRMSSGAHACTITRYKSNNTFILIQHVPIPSAKCLCVCPRVPHQSDTMSERASGPAPGVCRDMRTPLRLALSTRSISLSDVQTKGRAYSHTYVILLHSFRSSPRTGFRFR